MREDLGTTEGRRAQAERLKTEAMMAELVAPDDSDITMRHLREENDRLKRELVRIKAAASPTTGSS